jgi:diguanylate cyclase (GGDEF)-like protein
VPTFPDRVTAVPLSPTSETVADLAGGESMAASGVRAASDAPAPSAVPLVSPHAIAERVRERQLERVDVLERAVLSLMDGTLTDELRELAQSEAFAIASVMPSNGVKQGARIARALEQAFGARYTLERHLAAKLADHVLLLRTELEKPTMSPAAAATAEECSTIVLLSGDVEQHERYVTEGLASGVLVQPLDFTVDADVVRRQRPSAIIVALPTYAAPQAIAGLRRMARVGVPLLVVGGRGTLDERIAIARSRAVGPLSATGSAVDVLRRASELVDEARVAPGTVLIVDPDPWAAQTARLTLERAGHLVYTLFDADRLWETLETVAPEVLLVGARLGAWSGVDVALATRADPRWRDLPVLLAASAHEEAVVRAAYIDGVDDVLRKPLDPRLLSARVGNRLRLSRQLRRRDELDTVTGLPSRRKAERDLDRLLRLVRRHAQRFTLLSVRLDRHDVLRQRHGQTTIDRVLRRIGELARRGFRADDLIARWGPAELVIGLFDADAMIARERARELMAAVRAEAFVDTAQQRLTVTCSIGIAAAPEIEPELAVLHAAADSALAGAGAHALDDLLVVASDPNATAAERLDVLVVDADTVTSSLVQHALEGRRYRVRTVRDGAEAATLLAGERPALSPRVVVLEVNLPTLDGLSVLRALAAAHVLRRTRVLMLSSRDSEAETLQAFELGAFDYVPKPFNVNVLVERIRRALLT